MVGRGPAGAASGEAARADRVIVEQLCVRFGWVCLNIWLAGDRSVSEIS